MFASLGAARADHGYTMAEKIQRSASEMTFELGRQLGVVTFGLIDLGYDFGRNLGKLHLGSGPLTLDSKFEIEGSVARFQPKLRMTVMDHDLRVALPELQLSTDSVQGSRAVQVTVPLLRTRF
jgi:hypothetical protein